MFEKLEQVEKRFDQVGDQLQDPQLVSDQQKYRQLMKEYSDLKEIVEPFRSYRKVKNELTEKQGTTG